MQLAILKWEKAGAEEVKKRKQKDKSDKASAAAASFRLSDSLGSRRRLARRVSQRER